MSDAKEIFLNMIGEAASICVLGHTNPDGDCHGSTLGVYNYVRANFPEKRINVYLMQGSPKFSYMPGFSEIIHVPSDRKYALAIICDLNSADRLGDFKVLADHAEKVFVVDHHVLNDDSYHDIPCQILPEASSASEVVFDLMDREKITKDVATCLYTGIVHDTGVFKYNATSPHTMEIAGFLMSKGINFGSIIDDSFYTKTYTQQQVLGRVLMESMLVMERRVIVGWLRLRDLKFYHVTSKDIDGIVSTMRETSEIDAAVFFYEVTPQTFKVSLRSNNDGLNVAAVAQRFSGGGHVMAAGCTLQGTPYDVINNITAELAKQMDAPLFVSRRMA